MTGFCMMATFAFNELTYFTLMLHYFIPWQHQKTSGILAFLGGIEIEQEREMVNVTQESYY